MAEQELHVMIVEDSDAYRSILKRQIGQIGVKNIYEANGVPPAQEVLNKLEKDPNSALDLVFLDFTLTTGTADELVVRIRANPKWKKIPIIIISAETSPDIMLGTMNKGATAFLEKPIAVEQLKQIISDVKKSK